MWLKCDKRLASSVHLASCLCSLFLIHPVTSRLLCPHHQHLLLTFSVLHVRSTEPVSIHKSTRSLEGVWSTGRLVSTHENDETSSSTRKLVANTQIIITCRRYSIFIQKKWRRSPIDATFSVESYTGQHIDVESVMSMKAALHFGKGFVKNSEIHLNSKFENIESVFDITQVFDTWTVWRRTSECGMPEIFITIMREINVGKWWMRRSSGRRQEYLSTLILLYVLLRWNKFQEQQKQWKGKLKDIDMYSPYQDAVGIGGEAIELEWKNFKIFPDCPFFKRSRKTWYRRASNRRNQMIFVSMFNDICGNQMIGIASQTLRKSTITRSSSFQDIGRFLVQAQRRHGTEVLTNNNSKKQDTLFSQTSVLRIDEFSNDDKTKVPFTSIEHPRTRNSCFRRFILQLSSVSTEQRRTGVLSSTWRMKRKDHMQFLWTVKCWLLWSQKK